MSLEGKAEAAIRLRGKVTSMDKISTDRLLAHPIRRVSGGQIKAVKK